MKAGRLATVLLAGLWLAGCAAEETMTVSYYKEHSDERIAKLNECKENPGEEKLVPNCANAKRAAHELAMSPDNNNVPTIR